MATFLLAPFSVGHHIFENRRGSRRISRYRSAGHERDEEEPEPFLQQQNNSDVSGRADSFEDSSNIQNGWSYSLIDDDSVFNRSHIQPATGQTFRQDGFISALTLFLIFLAAAWSIIACRWITQDQTIRIRDIEVFFMLIIYMCAACACMWTLNTWVTSSTDDRLWTYVLVKPRVFHTTERTRRSGSLAQRVQVVIQSSIPLVGIVIVLFVFFTLGLVLDIFALVCYFSCMSSYQLCGQLLHYVTAVFFYVLRIAFEGTLIVFAFSFHKKTFKRTRTVRYCLLTILVAILAVWFDSVMMYTRHVLPRQYQVDFSTKCGNQTLAKNSTDYQCITHTSQMQRRLNDVSPYLYPLHIEYALIVLEIIYHMYSSADDDGEEDAGGSRAGCRLGVPPLIPQPPSLDPRENEDVNNPAPDVESSTDDTPLTQSAAELFVSTQMRRVLSGSLPKTFIVSIVINLVLVVLAALSNQFDKSEYHWHFCYECYKASYFFLLSIVCLVGFKASEGAFSRFCNYSSLELLVIGFTMSYFLHGALELLSAVFFMADSEREGVNDTVATGIQEQGEQIRLIKTSERPQISLSLNIIVLVRGVLNFCQFYLQITFTMHISRVHVIGTLSRCVAKETVLILAVSNFGLWIIDSFVELGQMFPISQYYFTALEWDVVSSILTPMFMFVRFNSFFILLNAYLSLRDLR